MGRSSGRPARPQETSREKIDGSRNANDSHCREHYCPARQCRGSGPGRRLGRAMTRSLHARFYLWALRQWNRELETDFEFLRMVKDPEALHTVSILRGLSPNERSELVHGLAKRFHREGSIDANDALTEEDERRSALFDNLRRAYQRRGITDRERAKAPAPPLRAAERWCDRALYRHFVGDRVGAFWRVVVALALNPAAPASRSAAKCILGWA